MDLTGAVGGKMKCGLLERGSMTGWGNGRCEMIDGMVFEWNCMDGVGVRCFTTSQRN
jgi:hypothetical protein